MTKMDLDFDLIYRLVELRDLSEEDLMKYTRAAKEKVHIRDVRHACKLYHDMNMEVYRQVTKNVGPIEAALRYPYPTCRDFAIIVCSPVLRSVRVLCDEAEHVWTISLSADNQQALLDEERVVLENHYRSMEEILNGL